MMMKKPEYGTDSYNRPGKNKFIGPSRGIAGSLLQKKSVGGGGGVGNEQMRSTITKKQEQSLMKRHCKLIVIGEKERLHAQNKLLYHELVQ